MLRSVCGVLGAWHLRGWLGTAAVFLVYRRVGVAAARMERLVARFQAGRLWRVEGRAGVVRSGGAGLGEAVAGGRAKRAAGLPVRFGWLVECGGYQAAGIGSQLRTVLETPEMVALLVAAPQAARILGPVCRMLAVETSLLRPGAAVVPVAAVVDEVAADEVAVVRPVRRARKVVDWGRIPLPRGVLSAARRQGFGKPVAD